MSGGLDATPTPCKVGDMTNTETPARRAAARIIDLANTLRTATRPVDQRTARAALDAACTVAHAFGWGMTPFAVEIAALDAIDKIGTMPPATAHNTERKAWAHDTTARLLLALDVA